MNTGIYDRTEDIMIDFIHEARRRKKSGNKAEKKAPNLLFFTGPSGIGKSTSLVKLSNEFLKKRGWYVYYYDLASIFNKFKFEDCLNVMNVATTHHKDSKSMKDKLIGRNIPESVQKKRFAPYIDALKVLLEHDKEVLIIFDGFHVFD